MSWDESVGMAGSLTIHRAVLRNDEGLVQVWQSPFQELPPVRDLEEGEERKGLTTFLAKELTRYSDTELRIAANIMVELADTDFLGAALSNPIYRALKEQREREGGYQPAENTAEEA